MIFYVGERVRDFQESGVVVAVHPGALPYEVRWNDGRTFRVSGADLVRESVPSFERIAADISAWSAATFPASTVASTLTHLQREVAELDIAVNHYAPDLAREEAADVAFLLVQLVRLLGGDLLDEVRRKWVVNQARVWQKPDSEGVVEHVRERDDVPH